MWVETLTAQDFRNYRNATVDFSERLNLVVGRNAQGKTNLLEAVNCLSGLGSPRAPDSALVREGAERALVHADVMKDERRIRIAMEMRPGRGTRALLNGTPLPRVRALGELVTCVFFGPDELSLVKGSPDGRRRFLDDLVVKLRPSRDGLRREWERVLKQRNALLKSGRRLDAASTRATLEVWDESLAKSGAALAAARLTALGALVPHARKRYEEVAGGGALDLAYESSWVSEELAGAVMAGDDAAGDIGLLEAMRAGIEDLRARELERGVSLVGPHRDDVVVRLSAGDGSSSLLDARMYASQGDQRTAALGLKLGEHDLLTDSLGRHPILLLDDVFSELDPQRRQWLAEAVKELGQTILSSAEPGAAEAAGADRILSVAGGRLEEA